MPSLIGSTKIGAFDWLDKNIENLYEKLLKNLYQTLVNKDLNGVVREGEKSSLLKECFELQKSRNGIVHRGEKCNLEQAENCGTVAAAVIAEIVRPVLYAIGLDVIEKGQIITT